MSSVMRRVMAAAGTVVAALPASGQLVNSDWNKDNGDFLWATGGNWTNGVPNGANASARFRNAISAARTITVANAGFDVGQMVFETDNAAKSYTITGGSLTFKNATQNRILVDANNKAMHTIASNIKIDVNDLVLESAAANVPDFAVRTKITGGLFQLNNTARALRVRGTGYFDLDTESNFLTGGTFVEQGRLRVKGDKALGNGNKDISIVSGDLLVGKDFSTTRKVQVGKAVGKQAAAIGNQGEAEFKGVISGTGGLILFGQTDGRTKLTADNTFTGPVDILGTQVDIAKAANLGKGTETLTMADAMLNVSGDANLGRSVQVIAYSGINVAAKKTVTVDKIDGIGGQPAAFDVFRKLGAGTVRAAGKATVPLRIIELNEGEIDVAGRVLVTEGIVADLLGKPKVLGGGGEIEGRVLTAPQTTLKPKKGNKESLAWRLDQTGDLEIGAGTAFELGISAAGGLAGEVNGWGMWNLQGSLLLGATAVEPLVVRLSTVDFVDAGAYLPDFDPAQAYAWRFIGVSGGTISGFDASSCVVDASGFWNLTYGGSFSVSMGSDGLYVNFTPAPAPGALGALGLAGLLGVRRRR